MHCIEKLSMLEKYDTFPTLYNLHRMTMYHMHMFVCVYIYKLHIKDKYNNIFYNKT